MEKKIKLKAEGNRIFISEERLGLHIEGGVASGSDVMPESMLLATVDKQYLRNAILFAKSDEVNRLLLDTISALRIASGESSDNNVKASIDKQIKELVRYTESAQGEYLRLK